MNPHTKFQKKCYDLFIENMECSDEVKTWVIENFLGHTNGFPGSYNKRKVSYCAKCGKRTLITDDMPVNADGAKTYECAGCGSEIRVYGDEWLKRRKSKFDETINVYRVFDDLQFIFYCRATIVLQKCHPAEAKIKTLGAFTFDGKRWIRIRHPKIVNGHRSKEFKVFPHTQYLNNFYRGIDNEFFSQSNVYPKRELLPVLKYRGFDTEGKSPVWKLIEEFSDFEFFTMPDMSSLEIAAKKHDFDYIKAIFEKDEWDGFDNWQKTNLPFFNQAYIIANRHHYTPEDWILWRDMVAMLVGNKKDIHNPKYVCPPDLRQAHQVALKATRKRWKIEAQKREREEFEKRCKYFENGPFDIFWHEKFNPDFSPATFPKLLQEYGYHETEDDIQWREKKGIPERPILCLWPEDFVNEDTGDIETLIRSETLSTLVEDENGNLHYELMEEYRGFDIKLSPDNVVLNPDELPLRMYSSYSLEYSNSHKESAFDRLKSRFKGLIFQDEELTLMTLNSAEEYCKEADYMHNCIATLHYYLKQNSLIMSARVDDKPVADVEIRLADFSILQCFGPCNAPTPYRERIEALIEANKDKIKERMAIEQQ